MRYFQHILFLTTVLLHTACSSTDFRADDMTLEQLDSIPISFGSSKPAVTRAAGNLEALEGTMKVFAAKKIDSKTYYSRAIDQYALWNSSNDPATAGDWEYVGAKNDKKTVIEDGKAGTQDNFTVPKNQVLKFWDYKASHYMFWAVAPYSSTAPEFGIRSTNETGKNTAIYSQFDSIDGHLTANCSTTATVYKKFYISNPIRVDKANYSTYTANNPVMFIFNELHSKVRVAFYETIPNYKVVDIKFYDNQTTPVAGNNIVFNRDAACFVGGSNGTDAPYVRCTYDNTDLTYSIAYKNMIAQKWIQFGKLDLSESSPMADASVEYNPSWGTDGDMSSDYYFTVLPTPTSLVGSTAPITLKVDFTIMANDDSKETIEIKGVTATVPVAFSTWKPNHAYSYVFKLTKACLNLEPIEFDAESSSILDFSTLHEESMTEE